jgi:hypothetical protein
MGVTAVAVFSLITTAVVIVSGVSLKKPSLADVPSESPQAGTFSLRDAGAEP